MALLKRKSFVHKHDQKNTRVEDLIKHQLKYPDVNPNNVLMNRSILCIIPTVGHLTEAYMDQLYLLLNKKAVEDKIKILRSDINLIKNMGLWDYEVERSIIEYKTKQAKFNEMVKLLPNAEQAKYREEQFKEAERLFKEFGI